MVSALTFLSDDLPDDLSKNPMRLRLLSNEALMLCRKENGSRQHTKKSQLPGSSSFLAVRVRVKNKQICHSIHRNRREVFHCSLGILKCYLQF